MKLPELNASTLLREHGLRADKGLGQNFLHDPVQLELIADAAEIQPKDVVLEIGPGLGSLTRYLALSAQSVISVELDHDLIPVLKSVLAPYPNIRIIEGDILNISPSAIMGTNDYIVVANVPYYITSAIFRHLLGATPRPRRIVLTVQKEVAERICAKPGDMSLLALSVQIYGTPRITHFIPSEAFYPVPKVDSAVLRVDLNPTPLIPEDQIGTFFLVAKAGFSQKRKTLRNSMSGGLRISTDDAGQILEKSEIDPMRRAETLTMKEWFTLTRQYLLDRS
ncbi:MAG: 16S rRNA (adenine(1518)-N(6)/adenine(1519)-N(6))-dimethyltransferase RsmA [Chloroflexi bacterium]|nr:16S rRNA (adenine(1518)-N(6)/adenine(1519)-N(6))-dimethyltransferase RsmA [Chloroflexota bacterium]